MDSRMQVRKLALKVLLVVLPRPPVHARRGISLKLIEHLFVQVRVDVVQEREELVFFLFSQSLSYSLQHLSRVLPALCPERALLARIPLGLGPSLHRLLHGSLHFVRRLRCYYGLVRLPASVHHRLWLLAFPMRTAGVIS